MIRIILLIILSLVVFLGEIFLFTYITYNKLGPIWAQDAISFSAVTILITTVAIFIGLIGWEIANYND